MRLVKRFAKQIVLTTILGFAIHKLLASEDPRAQRVGHTANRLVGGAFGPETTETPRSRTRTVAKAATTAAAGGAISYFFDPSSGADRRAKVKRFATSRLGRTSDPYALPVVHRFGGDPVPAIAPGVPS